MGAYCLAPYRDKGPDQPILYYRARIHSIEEQTRGGAVKASDLCTLRLCYSCDIKFILVLT